MKQIHHRAPAPAPQGLFDHRQIVSCLRSQREGFATHRGLKGGHLP